MNDGTVAATTFVVLFVVAFFASAIPPAASGLRAQSGDLPFNPSGLSWVGSTTTQLTLRWTNQAQCTSQVAGGPCTATAGTVLSETIQRLAPSDGYVGPGACAQLTQQPTVVSVTVPESVASGIGLVAFYNLTGLVPGAQYCDLTILATNGNGTNENPNGVIGAISTTGFPTVPPAPSSLRLAAISGTEATVGWSQGSGDANLWGPSGVSSGATFYPGPYPPAGEISAVGLRIGGDPTHSCTSPSYTTGVNVGNTSVATVGGLAPLSFYCLSVEQSNQSGTSNWSAPIGFETLAPGESESFNGSVGGVGGFAGTGVPTAYVAVAVVVVAAATFILLSVATERRQRR